MVGCCRSLQARRPILVALSAPKSSFLIAELTLQRLPSKSTSSWPPNSEATTCTSTSRQLRTPRWFGRLLTRTMTEDHVMTEIEFAVNHGVPILPILVDDMLVIDPRKVPLLSPMGSSRAAQPLVVSLSRPYGEYA